MATNTLETALEQARPRHLRWMMSLTGQAQSAEDIVQEAYLEAWRNQHKITDFEGIDHWLNAITHNVYKRWYRKNSKTVAHEADISDTLPSDPLAEYELDKDDLSDLLDQALAQLSPETRAIILARYLEEQPQAKVAHDMGLSESAVAVRLHRGKLALRKSLETPDESADEWQTTRIWCGSCGQAQYRAKSDPENGRLLLLCPHCCTDERYPAWGQRETPTSPLLVGITSIKSALTRLMKQIDKELRSHLATVR